MPHSDGSVSLCLHFSPPFFSPRLSTRCRFPSTNLAAMTSEQCGAQETLERMEEKNDVCVCVFGGGGGG